MACFSCHGVDGGGAGSGAFARLTGLPGWRMGKPLIDYASGARPNRTLSADARRLTEPVLLAPLLKLGALARFFAVAAIASVAAWVREPSDSGVTRDRCAACGWAARADQHLAAALMWVFGWLAMTAGAAWIAVTWLSGVEPARIADAEG